MDEKSQELYQEEQRQLLIDLKGSVDKLIGVFTGKVSVEYKQAESQTVKGEVTVANPVKEVTVSNQSEITEALKGFSEVVAAAIKEAKTDPVTEVSVKNIKDSVVDEVTIKNIKDLTNYFDQVVKAIFANRPVINVEKQEITWPISAKNPIAVRLSDGKSFYKAIATAMSGGVDVSGIITAINSSVVPLADYGLARQDLDADPLYFGYVKPSTGEWYIKRISFDEYTTTYYTDSGSISDSWDDRATFTYVEINDL